MAANVQHKRGTKAALDALALANGLLPYQIYVLTDQDDRMALATSAATYDLYAKLEDTVASFPKLIVSKDAGGDASFQNIPEAFTTINIDAVALDSHNAWDPATFHYVVPQTGLYDCSAKCRPQDNAGAHNFGLGIDIANQDSASFTWATFPTGSIGNTNRFVLQNRRVFRLTQGQRLRIFSYNGRAINKAELIAMRIA